MLRTPSWPRPAAGFSNCWKRPAYRGRHTLFAQRRNMEQPAAVLQDLLRSRRSRPGAVHRARHTRPAIRGRREKELEMNPHCRTGASPAWPLIKPVGGRSVDRAYPRGRSGVTGCQPQPRKAGTDSRAHIKNETPKKARGDRRAGMAPPFAKFRTRRPAHICETSRYRAVFERPSYVTRWRRTGWLGREYSNLCIWNQFR